MENWKLYLAGWSEEERRMSWIDVELIVGIIIALALIFSAPYYLRKKNWNEVRKRDWAVDMPWPLAGVRSLKGNLFCHVSNINQKWGREKNEGSKSSRWRSGDSASKVQSRRTRNSERQKGRSSNHNSCGSEEERMTKCSKCGGTGMIYTPIRPIMGRVCDSCGGSGKSDEVRKREWSITNFAKAK